MKRFSMLAAALALAAMIGCATQVTVTPTHRENMAAQSKVLASAAGDLERVEHQHDAEGGGNDAVRAIVGFHAQAENFAGTVGSGRSDEKINTEYEHQIESYVKLKKTFPNLSTDQPTKDAYTRVQYEWEQLARASGYSNRKYEKQIEQGK
jgi:hypothetical protein